MLWSRCTKPPNSTTSNHNWTTTTVLDKGRNNDLVQWSQIVQGFGGTSAKFSHFEGRHVHNRWSLWSWKSINYLYRICIGHNVPSEFRFGYYLELENRLIPKCKTFQDGLISSENIWCSSFFGGMVAWYFGSISHRTLLVEMFLLKRFLKEYLYVLILSHWSFWNWVDR